MSMLFTVTFSLGHENIAGRITMVPIQSSEDIDFTHDVTLAFHRYEDMQHKTTAVEEAGSQIGLKIITLKTMSMRVSKLKMTP